MKGVQGTSVKAHEHVGKAYSMYHLTPPNISSKAHLFLQTTQLLFVLEINEQSHKKMHYCKETLIGEILPETTSDLWLSVLALISPGTPRQAGLAVLVAWGSREPGLDSTKVQGQLSAVTVHCSKVSTRQKILHPARETWLGESNYLHWNWARELSLIALTINAWHFKYLTT